MYQFIIGAEIPREVFNFCEATFHAIDLAGLDAGVLAVHPGPGQGVVHPGSLTALMDPACLAEDGEMLGYTRLRDFENGHEIADAYFASIRQ